MKTSIDSYKSGHSFGGKMVRQGSNSIPTLPTENLVQSFDGTITADGIGYVDNSSLLKNLQVVRNSCYLLLNTKNTTYPTQVNFDAGIVTIEAYYYRTNITSLCYIMKFATKGVIVYFQNNNNAGRITYRIYGSTASLAANADTGVLLPLNTWTKVKFVIQNGVQQGLKVYLNDSETPSFAGADTRSLGTLNYDNKFVMAGSLANICRLSIKQDSAYNLFAPCAEGYGLTSYDVSGNGNHGVHDIATIASRYSNPTYQDIYNYNNNNAIDVLQSNTFAYAGNLICKPAKDFNGNAIAYVDRETALYGAYSPYYSTQAIKGINRSNSLYKLQATTENIASDYQNFWFDSGGVPIIRTWEEIVGLKAKWFGDKNTPHVIKALSGYSTSQDAASIAKVNKFCRNNPVEIWINAGASLAASSITPLSSLNPSELGEYFYSKVWQGTDFKLLNTRLRTHNYTSGGNNDYYPTFFKFQQLRAQSGRECYFIHWGVGGSRIYQDPAQSYNWNVNTVGGSYATLKTMITNAIAWLDKFNIPYVFKGVIWQMGGNDADPAYQPSFKQNTIDLITGLRNHVGATIPFYMTETSNYNATAPLIRADQQAICNELTSCVFIEDTDVTYVDGQHPDVAGKQLIAERIAARVI